MEGLFPHVNLRHYRIVSRLGVGGMGEVYLARDTKLDRKVALKILPEDLNIEAERMRRFVQEAKAASALNHPNIITIYEIGEAGNKHFIAAEYIDGETLRSRLNRGPMPLNSVLDAGVQIASALQAAHEAKIIHRDIKPENVMVRPDGLIKLLDFGIAKVSEPATALSADAEAVTTIKGGTSPGFIVGTAAYMSPEQAKGQVVDARTDIFSFGVVLYEMLTGRKPFEGETAMDVIGATLHKEPLPIRQLMPEAPSEIERIINKLLRKDCNERYQTVKDVLVDLKDVRKELEFQDKLKVTAASGEKPKTEGSSVTPVTAQTNSSAEYIVGEIKKRKLGLVILAVLLLAAVGIFYFVVHRPSSSADNLPIASIAVLPFQNKSADKETEYLSDGLAESLIFGLSQLSDLKVSPTSLVFRYKGKEIDPIKIGSELGVNAVMTGRLAQRVEDLTISVELVDVRNNKLLWGKQYDRKLVKLLTTQQEIATEITQSLKLKLSGADERRVTRHYAKNSEAYRLYLKGHYYASRYTKEGFSKGIEYFAQAIAKDPNFALAYSGLAFCYLNQTDWVFAPRDSVPKTRQAVENALRIDETLAEAHTMLAMILLQYDWDWLAAEREFRRAIEIDPNYALGRSFLAWHLAAMGRFDESIEEDKRALDLDPLSPAVNADLG
ncbi:MAG: protein kinase domain-containing protein [Pyrinomonadaceae bacterium]